MAQLRQILLDCDLAVFITDPSTRLDWVKTWKKTIGQFHSSNITCGSADNQTLELISKVSNNQRLVAEQIRDLEKDNEREMAHMHLLLDELQLDAATNNLSTIPSEKEQIHPIFGPRNPSQDHHPSPPSAEEADNHLRDWYLLNITRPFPDKAAKERLTALTGMDARQLNTWFTNMRRRSGYTESLRAFADGDKERFVELCGEAERGEEPEAFKEALSVMKGYVGRKPKGKVGDWLLHIIEESNREEDTRPAKKARLANEGDDPRLSQPEHTIAPPQTSTEGVTPIKPETHNTPPDESHSDTNAAPASDAKRPPTKPKSTRPPPKKQIKMYTFSPGASDDTPTKPSSRRRPTATSRPSPLRSVSDSSTDSLHAVDSGLRSVSGSSTTASNVSGDLNFSFPAFQQATPPQRPVLVRVPSSDAPLRQEPRNVPQYQQPRNTPYHQLSPIFPFGIPETSQYVFNPDLPHMVQLQFTSPYPAYHQPMLYPPIQLTAPAPPTYGYQQFTTFQQPTMQFSKNFGSMKRGFEAVGETGDERVAKMARFKV